MLTYFLLQMWQDLAFSGVRALWVCLCRDKLELEAKCFPHSAHWYLAGVVLKFFTSISGRDMSEQKEEAGETGGEEKEGTGEKDEEDGAGEKDEWDGAGEKDEE